MKFKYIISLSTFVTLTGLSCWGAVEQPKNGLMEYLMQSAEYGDVDTVRRLALAAAATNAFDDVSDEVILYIAGSLDPSSLMRMAQVNKRFNNIIIHMPKYKLFLEFLELHLNENNGSFQQTLFDAIRTNYPDAADIIDYVAKRINIDAPEKSDRTSYTALMVATENNNDEAVRILIDNGANVDLVRNDMTALEIAIKNRRTNIAVRLLKAGANVNRRDYDGTTPLMTATLRGDAQMVRILLEHGANKNIKDNEGATALDFSGRNEEIVQMLNN